METEETTKPVENVALTTKGLQQRNRTCEWDDGGKIGNTNKWFHYVLSVEALLEVTVGLMQRLSINPKRLKIEFRIIAHTIAE